MRFIIILACLASYVFGCDLPSMSHDPRQGPETVISGPTPDRCAGPDFKPKTEAELSALTPHQLIAEKVNAEFQRRAFASLVEWADYSAMVSRYISKAGASMLPVLTEYINAYDPENASECEAARFSMAGLEADNLDRHVFRLRGSSNGRLTITALERAVDRLKAARFNDEKRVEKANRKLRIHEIYLRNLKGVNDVDRSARDTLWVGQKIVMSDDELLEFSNFLVSLDPTYPSWSTTDLIRDQSKINEAGSEAQVYIFKQPKRFYEAYREFKNQKRVK